MYSVRTLSEHPPPHRMFRLASCTRWRSCIPCVTLRSDTTPHTLQNPLPTQCLELPAVCLCHSLLPMLPPPARDWTDSEIESASVDPSCRMCTLECSEVARSPPRPGTPRYRTRSLRTWAVLQIEKKGSEFCSPAFCLRFAARNTHKYRLQLVEFYTRR